MSSICYYYLDGIDKKGPFSKDEIISKNLPPTTLIYHDGLTNWTPLSQFRELKQPILVNKVQPEKENNIDQPNIFQSTKIKSKVIKIPLVLFLIITLCLTTLFSYLYTNIKRKKDLQQLETKINTIFKGKDEVCDYKYNGVSGKLREPDIYTPFDNERNRLVEYHECDILRGEGWFVLTLKRINNGFYYTNSYSTKMGFKVPESYYTPGKDFGYGYRTEGYSIPSHRGTIENAYKNAMHYISTENENKSYLEDSYLKIYNFNQIKTDFHYISNVESWERRDESVFNSKCIVWYNTNGKHYEIVESQKQFNKIWLTCSLISGLIAILIFFLVKYRKRLVLKVT